MNINLIKQQIDKVSVVSFDIFDTLLLRPYMKPTDVFKHLELLTEKIGFYNARKEAENQFYLMYGREQEATLDNIYQMIPEYADLKEKELELEYDTLYVNSEIKELYDYALKRNKTIIITSDMYLPFYFIKNVLKKNGFLKYKQLYLSNQLNKRKDKGNLYDYIIKDLKVLPKTILHIGDNANSDYKKALEHGLKAVLYSRIDKVFLKENQQFSKFYKSYSETLCCSILTAIAAQKKQTNDYWYNFGYCYAGPIVFGYSNWIYTLAIKQELDKILCVARDGYIVEKVLNLLDTQQIKTKYVYAPRILNYTANLDYDPNLKEQPRIICEYFGKTPSTECYHEFIQMNKSDFIALAKAEKEKTGYNQYIKKIIGNAKKVGVVDTISGQLSAQKLIEKEGKIKTQGFYIATLPAKGRTILKELNHSDYFEDSLRQSFITDNKPDLIELIFSAPENPIITLKNGQPIYKEDISEAEKMRQNIYRQIEIGILDFTKNVLERFKHRHIFIQNIAISELIRLYVTKPSIGDIKAMFQIKKSPYADNSVYVPLFSAPIPCWKIKKLKKLIWLTPTQRIALCLASPIKIKLRGLKHFKIQIFPKLKKNIFTLCLLNRYGIIIGADDVRR